MFLERIEMSSAQPAIVEPDHEWDHFVPETFTCDPSTEYHFIPDDIFATESQRRASDHLQVLLHQERTRYPVCFDYLAASEALERNRDAEVDSTTWQTVNEQWRHKLCEWCYEVVDHFDFDREVVSYALHYLDRTVAHHFMMSLPPMGKREFQLVATTSLYLAIKLHAEIGNDSQPRRKLKIDAFVELSRGFFSVEAIEVMELKMLSILDWKLNPPTSLRFITYFLRLLPRHHALPFLPSPASVATSIFDVARYLCELSVCASAFTFSSHNSTVAYASIVCAMDALQHDVPMPRTTKIEFLQNLAAVTGVQPSDPEVGGVCAMLRSLAPNLFTGDRAALAAFIRSASGSCSRDSDDSRTAVKESRSRKSEETQKMVHHMLTTSTPSRNTRKRSRWVSDTSLDTLSSKPLREVSATQAH
jgi:Cyclin, N-terminal domain